MQAHGTQVPLFQSGEAGGIDSFEPHRELVAAFGNSVAHRPTDGRGAVSGLRVSVHRSRGEGRVVRRGQTQSAVDTQIRPIRHQYGARALSEALLSGERPA